MQHSGLLAWASKQCCEDNQQASVIYILYWSFFLYLTIAWNVGINAAFRFVGMG
ncbi:hypothetical protein BDF21DRAFT_422114 [Thamnidium elegans]|nr:hypothetical protein BDF21DRAFT_422112 [Thamnidium elegans]KAI8077129.1 hypothetical protein BDF21DRAFT_422114 [Thamnidium elegans]